ncbi:TPA: hypothetical protein DDZ86_04640 [Candidatus Dependentiae bacterium]|nr:MAG: hypothetical protein UW09_C0002G0159 [candidate division TM6 bacterium GW2011_GWF2_43_87]HBL98901.1 hypothetical protein [Candidatus Dependentiae bacterium]
MNRFTTILILPLLLLTPVLDAVYQNVPQPQQNQRSHPRRQRIPLRIKAQQLIQKQIQAGSSLTVFASRLASTNATALSMKTTIHDYLKNHAGPEISYAFNRVRPFVDQNDSNFNSIHRNILTLLSVFVQPSNTTNYPLYKLLEEVKTQTQTDFNTISDFITENAALNQHHSQDLSNYLAHPNLSRLKSKLIVSNFMAKQFLHHLNCNKTGFLNRFEAESEKLFHVYVLCETITTTKDRLKTLSKQIKRISTSDGFETPEERLNLIHSIISNDFLPEAQWLLNPIFL